MQTCKTWHGYKLWTEIKANGRGTGLSLTHCAMPESFDSPLAAKLAEQLIESKDAHEVITKIKEVTNG